jgi:hypothetical protein
MRHHLTLFHSMLMRARINASLTSSLHSCTAAGRLLAGWPTCTLARQPVSYAIRSSASSYWFTGSLPSQEALESQCHHAPRHPSAAA